MNIIGPDALAFGVDDVGACRDYLTAFGLKPIDVDDAGGFFEALDGTGVLVRRRDDPRLPAPMETAAMLRQTIYGVADRGHGQRDRRRTRKGPPGGAARRRLRRGEGRPRLRAQVSGDEAS